MYIDCYRGLLPCAHPLPLFFSLCPPPLLIFPSQIAATAAVIGNVGTQSLEKRAAVALAAAAVVLCHPTQRRE